MAEDPDGTDRRLSPVVRVAPAKLNLSLAVVGRRADGYHDLHSVMVPLGLADRLSVAVAPPGADTIRVVGRDAGPAADNLVLKAVAATRAALGRAVEAVPLAARLEKHIPVAAGLAGGSSDAAAAIDAALAAWGADLVLGPSELLAMRRRIASQIGSDVPFFFVGGPAIVTGTGRTVEPLPGLQGGAPGVLLVTPTVPVPTPLVFATFDQPGGGPASSGVRATSEHLGGEFRRGLSASALLQRAGVLASANDLAAAADEVVPGLRALRRGLTRLLGRPVGLSGSGPTLWVLYASVSEAEAAAALARAASDDGVILAPGDDPPTVIATSIQGGPNVGSDPGTPIELSLTRQRQEEESQP
ncbi:MAG: hypothetical protein ABI598_07680 [Chloroflexota bacterium]